MTKLHLAQYDKVTGAANAGLRRLLRPLGGAAVGAQFRTDDLRLALSAGRQSGPAGRILLAALRYPAAARLPR